MKWRSFAARWAPALSVLVGFALVVSLVIANQGFRVQRPDLNNSGIWVTNNAEGYYGRFNRAAFALDLALSPGPAQTGYALDVLQAGDQVVARDLGRGVLIPVDSAAGANLTEAALGLPSTFVVDLRGGTLASFDPVTGKLWAGRTGEGTRPVDVSVVNPENKPVAELGQIPAATAGGSSGAMAVGLDGSVYAVGITGKRVRIPVVDGQFGQPVYEQVTALQSVQLTVVGQRPVILDAIAGSVVQADGAVRTLATPDKQARLQQPGQDAGEVLLATPTTLLAIPLAGDGQPRAVFSGANGEPAAPVALGACQFGAWAGNPGVVVRGCDGNPATRRTVDRGSRSQSVALGRPVFRLNWNTLVVNDTADGRIFDVDLQRSFDDWASMKPQVSDDNTATQSDKLPTDSPPKADPDLLGARPGATSVLHVLDNDVDPNGQILAITKVTQPASGAEVEISPDGQMLRYTLAADPPKVVTFSYTVFNGIKEATAKVTVTTRSADQNDAPRLRDQAEELRYAVAGFSTLSMAVTGDWRDYDGDPVLVTSAAMGPDDVPVTAESLIDYTAGEQDKTVNRELVFQVTDGRSAAVAGKAHVQLLGKEETKAVAPVAAPDSARGRTGRPITIQPLGNDIPGADPTDPLAALKLATRLTKPQADVDVLTDLESGQVTVTAKRAGTYFLTYEAGFGAAAPDIGSIRVDVFSAEDALPVAMPDQAKLRGQTGVTVDVLANDSDPGGAMLTVVAAVPEEAAQLQVAVLRGRWLRILPIDADVAAQTITYTVTNGATTATGSVSVISLPEVQDEPLVRDDYAAVRVGDSTLVPVLANDTTTSGAALQLLDNIEGLPGGRLTVGDPAVAGGRDPGDVGMAFVHGDKVRYVAPAQGSAPRELVIEYIAVTADGDRTRGLAHVTVNPAPGEQLKDRAPAPEPIEVRTVAGDTVTITVPSAGQDPDGDSVSVVALASAPRLGRVIAVSGKGITYQAYPDAEGIGTDVFSYLVSDRYGATGKGTVRVGVSDPGQTQLPVAVDDQITARPNSHVEVYPLANDLVATADVVSVTPLADLNDDLPQGVELNGPRGPVVLTAPGDAQAEPLRLNYADTGNAGQSNTGTITVTAVDGYLNPPRVPDVEAKLAGKVATADVLGAAWDPDGDRAALRIAAVSEPGALVDGGSISVPNAAEPRVVTVQVADADGAMATAQVFVPPALDGPPYVTSSMTMSQDSTAMLVLAEHVVSPRGKPVTVFDPDSLSSTPGLHVTVEQADQRTLKVSAKDGYIGPASVTLQVTDGATFADPDARTAYVTVPVQVGPDVPVLRCPERTQVVLAGGVARTLNITSLCHVWTATSDALAKLTYEVSWRQDPGFVSTSVTGQSLELSAAGQAQPGSRGALLVNVPGTQAVPAVIPVLVQAAPPPRLDPLTFRDVKQGTTKSGSIAALWSPLRDRVKTIVSMTKTAGDGTASISGSRFTVTPAPTFAGKLTFRLVASDVADPTRFDRQVRTTVTVGVYGKPDAPAAPKPGRQNQSKAETLSFKAPDSNGAHIDTYELTDDHGGRFSCQSSPCTVKPLVNGQWYRFKLRAHNKAGWSELSGWSNRIRPDTVPDQVTGFRITGLGDGTLSFAWNSMNKPGEYTPISDYLIKWPGGSRQAGTGTTATISGLDNNRSYEFSILAKNAEGYSRKAATTSGQSSGKPKGLDRPTINPTRDTGANTPVRVSWGAVDPNGPTPVTYTVEGNGSQICRTTGTSCLDDSVTYNGANHTYKVTATNATGGAAHSSSSSASWDAVGIPDAWSGAPRLTATGDNRKIRVQATAPASRGSSSTLTIRADGATVHTASISTSGGAVDEIITVPANGTNYTITLRVCNEKPACSQASGTESAYGPIQGLSIVQAGAPDGFVVHYRVSVNPNGRPLTVKVNGTTIGTTGSGDNTWSSGTIDDNLGGYARTQSYTVTATGAGRSASDGPITLRSADTPPPARSVSVTEGNYGFVGGSCTGSNCREVLVTTSGFSGSYTCTVYGDAGAGGSFSSRTFTGDQTRVVGGYGFWGNHVWAICAGVESNHKTWTR